MVRASQSLHCPGIALFCLCLTQELSTLTYTVAVSPHNVIIGMVTNTPTPGGVVLQPGGVHVVGCGRTHCGGVRVYSFF